MSTLEKYFQDSDYFEEDKPLTTSILEVVNLIDEITFHTLRNLYEIRLYFDKMPALSELQRIKEQFLEEIGQGYEVVLIPLGLEKLDQDTLSYFLDCYQKMSPTTDVWLSKCLLKDVEDNRLTLEVDSMFILERLKKKNSLVNFRRFLEDVGFHDCEIILQYNEEASLDALHIDKTLKKYMCAEAESTAELAQRVQKATIECGETPIPKMKSTVIYGKRILGTARQICEVTEEEKDVIMRGSIFDLDVIALKQEKDIIQFHLTDLTDSITCKIFCKKEETPAIVSGLKDNNLFLLRGSVKYDANFSGEHCYWPNAINIMENECRVDLEDKKRVELHLHTQMSDMDGVSSLKELVSLASQMGHSAIAITDHGVVQAFPEAYGLGKKYGIKIIYGMEAYIFDDSIPANQKPRYYHCILLAKNKVGLENIYKMVTESHLRYYKRRPRIPKRLVNYAREGVIVGSACEAGELFQHLIHSPEDSEGLKTLAEFYDYIEIQPLDNNYFMIEKGLAKSKEDLINYNKRLYQLGQELGKMVVATCDVHFAKREEFIFRSIIMSNKGFKTSEQPSPLYYRTTREMLEEFSYLGEAAAYEVVVENTNKVAEQIESLQPVPDDLSQPYITGAEEEIERLTMTKAHELYGDKLPKLIEERVAKELNAIIGNGFAVLYLIAHKLVKKSNEDGYVVGSRGSVGSSIVAYFTGITDVNALPPHYRCAKCQYVEIVDDGSYDTGVDMPDKVCPDCGHQLEKDGYNIPFEIFMGFKGDKVPDIDLNFSGDYQPEAHRYTEELFGVDNVFRAGTITTIAEKTAIGYIKKYAEIKGENYKRAEISRLKNGCVGVKRSTGQHPGGQMVLPKDRDIHQFTPLQYPANDTQSETVTTHFDYHSISERLVKLDILGHDNPTIVRILTDLTGVDVRQIPLDDKATLSLFSSVEALGIGEEVLNTKVGTYGIPEFNTKFTREMLLDVKPKSFGDLLRISGFSHGTDVWLNNAKDLISLGIANVEETISTRDDIMTYLIHKGMDFSLAFKIMEKVRKGRGVSEEDIVAMREVKVPEWFVESCQKIKYLFPKAHAVAYVFMAFQFAWFKLNHPLAFYVSFFTVRGTEDFDYEVIIQGYDAIFKRIKALYLKGTDISTKEVKELPVLEVALECLARGFEFLPISIFKSDATKFVIENNRLRPPLVCVPNLGKNMAETIAKAREDFVFDTIEDLSQRARVGSALIDKMRELNVLENLPEKNQLALF